MAATNHYGVYAPLRQADAAHKSAPTGFQRSDLAIFQDRVQLAVGVEIGSKIFLADVNWEFIPVAHLSTISYDAAGAGVTLNIGDANSVNALLAAQAIAAAGSSGFLAAVDRANFGKQIWELLGYASLKAAQASRETARLYATVAGANLANITDLYWGLVGTNA